MVLLIVCLVPVLGGCTQYELPEEVSLFGYLYSTSSPEEDSQQVHEVIQAAVWSADGEVLVEGTQPYDEYPAWWSFGPLAPDTPVHVVFEAPDDSWVSTGCDGRDSRRR